MSEQVAISKTSQYIGKLAEALSAAQGKILNAPKTSENPHFRSKFSDLTEVWSACRVALSEAKIAVIQAPQFEGSEAWLETTLAHSSGEFITGRFPLRPTKNDMQGFGSALTYARRYSLAAMVGVTSEDDDGNAASAPVASQTRVTQQVFPKVLSSVGFDPKNVEHVRALKTKLEAMKIEGMWAKNVYSAMVGKSFGEADQIIKACNPEKQD